MAIDNKYGQVTLEHGSIGEDEPVIVFRAKDELLPNLIEYYYLCREAGSPGRHLDLITQTGSIVRNWQDEYGSRLPTSEASKEWMDEPGTS